MSGFGSAFSDLFQGAGDFAASSAYKQAAGYAGQEAEIAKRSGAIQLEQANRQIYQTISGQQAAVAGGGFTGGGSNQYLQRASEQQAGLTRAIVSNQTNINVLGFQAQQAADIGQAQQAELTGAGNVAGGILGIAASIFGF